MNNYNLCMHRCFKFQVQYCQNASIETLIRAAKFIEKHPSRAEDMDKMQTEFPRSGMHRG